MYLKNSETRGSLIIAFLLILLLTPIYAHSETATYSTSYTAPECISGSSVCEVPASLINGRDSITNGNEPNQPNTLSSSACADGSNGSYHQDESLDSFVLTGLSGPELLPGDTVELEAAVWCYNNSPELDIMYVYQADSADSPSWNFVGSQTCPAGGAQNLSVSFKLGNTVGKQAIRVAFTYNSGEDPCGSGDYNDRDDVVIRVGNTADGDGDGLYDWYENKYGCLMANTADASLDPDSDGLTNTEEYSYTTDPCDADTDGGGETDGSEIANGHDPLFASDDNSTNAVYDPAFTAPSCPTGESPCLVPETLINGRDNMSGGPEPNQPNTLFSSTCADGTDGDYHSDESLDSFIIEDLNNPYFLPGDTVEVEAYVWCWASAPDRDNLYIYHADSVSSPAWNQVASVQCTGPGMQKLTARFALGNSIGNQALRLAFTYDSPAASCDSGNYNDRDDVVLAVMDPVCEDNDGDGYGNGVTCLGPDCDDGDSSINPGASEVMCDGKDNDCDAGTPDDRDEDGDGLSYCVEQAEGTSDNDWDTDGDGLGDDLEVNTSCTDPLLADTDSDGLSDGVEDGNTNGAQDPGETDPCELDSDGDFMDDGWEVGNGCMDPLTGDSIEDYDADQLDNLDEYINSTDPCDTDTDSDGFDDGAEVNTFLTDPLAANADTDSDGLPDEVETGTGTYVDQSDTGSDPLNSDSDGDGMEDGDETLNEGTDPCLPDWGALEVSTSAGNTGCSVYLDGTLAYRGRYAGEAGDPATPLVVGNLKNERHAVTIACPDRFLHRSYVDVDHGDTLAVNADTEYRVWEVQTTRLSLTAGGSTIAVPGGYAAPHAADLDRNGTTDLLAGTGDGRILLYNNLVSTGLDLEAGVELYAGSTVIDVGAHAKPFVVDWNNDNCPDLLAGNSAGEVYLYPGTGDCAADFSAGSVLISAAETPGGRSAPYVVDWNNDHLKDLMVGCGDGRIKLYLNTGTDAAPVLGTGTFLTTAKGEEIDAGDHAAPLVYDFDRNGLLDLAFGRKHGTISGCLNVDPGKDTVGNLKVDIFEAGLHCSDDPWTSIDNDVLQVMDVGESAVVSFGDPDMNMQLDLFVGNAAGGVYYYPSGHLDGDIDRSTKVDGADWILLRQSMGLCEGDAGYNPGADLDGDGCVDEADKTILDSNFGYTY